MSRRNVTRDASLPDSHAENASPNAAAEMSMPDTISSLTRGVPSSSRNNGMIGPNVRSAMLTKKRINTVVKYSGRFQKGAVDGDEAFSSAERS